MMTVPAKKRNFYLSYIKGFAILGIIIVHLIEWSNITITPNLFRFREIFYPSVFLFLATSGAVTYLAYSHYDDLWLASRRLVIRGAQLIGVYFLYSFIKFFIFNFSREPFYDQFIANGKFTIANIFTLQSFSAPLSIILTIGLCLIISPALIWIVKRVKQPQNTILCLIVLLSGYNYAIDHSANWFTNFIFAKNNIMFPVALWGLVFLVGFYLALLGLEKIKGRGLLFFGIITIVCTWAFKTTNFALIPHHNYMYPLTLYFIAFGFAYLYLLTYLFTGLEKIKNKTLNKILALIRFLGDNTFSLYIYQWLVIDLTMWLWFPKAGLIWVTVPAFILLYIVARRHHLQKYLAEQAQA